MDTLACWTNLSEPHQADKLWLKMHRSSSINMCTPVEGFLILQTKHLSKSLYEVQWKFSHPIIINNQAHTWGRQWCCASELLQLLLPYSYKREFLLRNPSLLLAHTEFVMTLSLINFQSATSVCWSSIPTNEVDPKFY